MGTNPARWRWLVERFMVWKRVVWRPVFAVVFAIYGVLAALAFVRDYVLPATLSAQDAKIWQARLAPQLRFDWFWWVIGILVALLIVVLEGVFRVVRQDGREAATEREKLTAQIRKLEAEKPKPDFLVEFENVMTGGADDQPLLTVAHVVIRLVNRGAPSIADHWSIFVTIAGIQRRLPNVLIPENTEITMAEGGAKAFIGPSDAIYEKTTARIETGAQVRGWLRLDIYGIKPVEFRVPGSAIDVSCEDYLGRIYTAHWEFSGGRPGGPIPYFPGSGKAPTWTDPTKSSPPISDTGAC